MLYPTRKGARARWAAILGLALGPPAWARLVNVTTPEYPVTACSPTSPDGFGPRQAIDRNPATMFRAGVSAGIGITVAMPTPNVVKALRLCSGQDRPASDPASYAIEGSDDGQNFVVLGSGNVPAFHGRLVPQTFTFDNSEAYSFYRVSFPTIQDAAAAGFLSVGEVELLGSYDDNPDRPAPQFGPQYAVGGGSGPSDHGSWPDGPSGGASSGGGGGPRNYSILGTKGGHHTVTVPEPASLTLVAGLATMMLQSRRRRQRPE